jgi:hypothetical protein
VPTLSLIPPTLSLSSVQTGDEFLEALKAHDTHFGTLRAEAAAGAGGGGTGAVLRYVGVIDVDSRNGNISLKASLERYVPPMSCFRACNLMRRFTGTRRRTRSQRHSVGRIISSCFKRNAMERVH